MPIDDVRFEGIRSLLKLAFVRVATAFRVLCYGQTTAGAFVAMNVDADGDLQVDVKTGGGGGAQYAEDGAHASGETGTLALVVRNDALAALCDADGDRTVFQVNASGALFTDGSQTTQPVSGPLTDAELRAADVKVSLDGEVISSVVIGDAVHDAADGSNGPVKIGAKAADYDPDTTGEQGVAEVAAADRVNLAANLRGELVTAVKPEYSAPTAVDATYNNATTVNTSDAIECWQYRMATLVFELDKAGTGNHYITLEIMVSGDGTNYSKLMNGPLGSLVYDDATIGAGVERAITFPICANDIKIKATSTNTTVDNTITLANTILYMRT